MLAKSIFTVIEQWMMRQTPSVLYITVLGTVIALILLYGIMCIMFDISNYRDEQDIKVKEERNKQLEEEYNRLRGE